MMNGFSGYSVAERLMRYVQIDTQSDPLSSSFPSTIKQKNLSQLLVQELHALQVADAHTDEYGYVYATIPANTNKPIPVICFCAHIDTAPDCSGTNIKPLLHKSYSGHPIVLPDDSTIILDPNEDAYLKQHIGKDIITASGLTLLGADDKAGVAIIMNLVEYLMQNPSIPHGTIKILFTPDEEVGRGTNQLNLQKLGADFAYTLDGGELGTFEDETFSANGFTIHIEGVIAHPGYAKDKMVNALKVAAAIVNQLPKTILAPEVTEKKQGFVHPVRIEGLAEKATIEFIIRDFETAKLAEHQECIKQIALTVLDQFPGAKISFAEVEQYRNMKAIIEQYPFIGSFAEEAYNKCGLTFIKEPIRGGTDGSRLSFLGLPCPNIFTGMQAIHSKKEWVGVADMERAVDVLVQLVQVWEEKGVNLTK
ncbi:peptidase T [Sediminibacterium sp.]|uniref:peptidase T n=1 Tax=Sediminibacterium sp. TaxID=1917865 RepID=UPI0027346BB4|nr:peptidase T [Sediminibacterium sp.]MDP3392678.1 peptidase T [Sediminibacterium sp.]MDP3566079.1 peptidase T [Sediminibacterium sp.]